MDLMPCPFEQELFATIQADECSREKAQLIFTLIEQTRPTCCVEIGVFQGASLLPIAASLRAVGHGHVIGIDAWSNLEATRTIPTYDHNWSWWSSIDLLQVKYTCLRRLAETDLTPYCTLLHASSAFAAPSIGPIDFLHLDGNFSESGAYLDYILYFPKVNPGGHILLSHAFTVVNREIPKMKTLWALLDTCEIVAEIEHSNAILFQKPFH